MDDLELILLYDYYGNLLTARQREVFELRYDQDLSLGEIGEELGISRQGVHDLVKRCNKTLAGYEDKLKLVQKFNLTKQMVEEIKELAGAYKRTGDKSLIDQIEALSEEIGRL